jgi:hypothetical protein
MRRGVLEGRSTSKPPINLTVELIVTAIPISFSSFVERPAPAFIQIGDLLRMLLRPGRRELAGCDFCQTINDRTARCCAGCGGKLRNSSVVAIVVESFPSRFLKKLHIAAPASTQFLVFPTLLLMFASVAFGLLLHLTATWSSDALPTAPTAMQQKTAVNTASRTDDGSTILDEPPASKDATAAVRVSATGEDEGAASTESRSTITSSPIVRPAYKPRREQMALPQSASAERQDLRQPFTGCGALNFFARAVCINNQCAKPRLARQLQCRKAVYQRRIDEARRNSL